MQAGRFLIEMSGPHPVWVALFLADPTHEPERALRFSHKELRDLKHVVDAAVREAGARLGPEESKRYGLDVST